MLILLLVFNPVGICTLGIIWGLFIKVSIWWRRERKERNFCLLRTCIRYVICMWTTIVLWRRRFSSTSILWRWWGCFWLAELTRRSAMFSCSLRYLFILSWCGSWVVLFLSIGWIEWLSIKARNPKGLLSGCTLILFLWRVIYCCIIRNLCLLEMIRTNTWNWLGILLRESIKLRKKRFLMFQRPLILIVRELKGFRVRKKCRNQINSN